MNTDYPLISTIIPSYNNRLDLLEEAIESILSQSYTNWEVIIVNDGSSSEYSVLLDNFMQNLPDKRISIIRLDKNYGCSVARSKGIEASNGEILTFLDADDLYLPWYYEKVIEAFKRKSNIYIVGVLNLYYLRLWKIKKLCLSNAFYDLIEGKINSDTLVQRIKAAQICEFPRMALKKEVFKKVSYDPELISVDDGDLFLQIINNDDFLNGFYFISDIGYIYRIFPSRRRYTSNMDLLLQGIEKITYKYSNKNSLASKLVAHWQNVNDLWKFNKLLINYCKGNSYLSFFSENFSNFHSLKDKIKSIRALINTISSRKILSPLLGIDQTYTRVLFNNKNNKYKKFKGYFVSYLKSSSQNNDKKFYAKKMFEKIF